MLDIIQSGARLFLIASASVVLALVGLVLSILAYIRLVIDEGSRRVRPDDVVATPESTSRPRDRVSRPRPHYPRPPRSHHDSSESSGDHLRRAGSVHARRTRSRPLASRHSSKNTQTPSPSQESERRSEPRKRRLLKATREKSVRDSTAAGPLTPLADPEDAAALPPLNALHTFSDVSSIKSELSTGSLTSGEKHSPISDHHVLKKIKEHHSQLRERCLNRAQSLPAAKSSTRPTRRTDPYQAPYFFPTPMSPTAATYLQEVVNERQGTHTHPQPAVAGGSNEPTEPLVSFPSRSAVEDVQRPTHLPSPPVSPLRSRSQAKVEASPHPRRHRWSWHIPHLPLHHPSHGRQRSVDDGPPPQEKGGAAEHKEIFSKLKFGHHRRRHRSGSDSDARARTSGKAS